MSLFRSVLTLLILAVLGGLIWQLLATDPGLVLVRFRGTELSSTVPAAVLLTLSALILLWIALRLAILPWLGWRRLRRGRARRHLRDAMLVQFEGRPSRAAKLLEKVAKEPTLRATALIAAARAAHEAGEGIEAERLLDAASVAGADLPVRMEQAERALEQHLPERAIELLSAAREALPPRALLLKARALNESGRADTALTLLPMLRSTRARTEADLEVLEKTLILATLRQADSGESLAGRWNRLTKNQRLDPEIAEIFAERMAAFGFDDDAAAAIEKSLAQRWSESLVERYGLLPGGQQPRRLKVAEGWLRGHPDSAMLALTLARLSAAQRLSGKAGGYLHRAIAQGAGALAWELLAVHYDDQGDPANARLCLENALRVGRDQPALELPQRDLALRIGDFAVTEERDQHGVPRLSDGSR